MGKPAQKQKVEFYRTPERSFGYTLRKIRVRQGLSQQVLADRSGYHRTYIGLLESGLKSPSLRTIWNIATVLHVRPSEMLKQIERLVERTNFPKTRRGSIEQRRPDGQ